MVSTRQQRRLEAQRKIIQHFEEKIPYFTDIFDERSFYIFASALVVACLVLVVILSYFCPVEIRDADEIERERQKRKRMKQQKLIEKLLMKRLIKAGMSDAEIDLKKAEKMRKLLERLSKSELGKESEIEVDDDDLLLHSDETTLNNKNDHETADKIDTAVTPNTKSDSDSFVTSLTKTTTVIA